MRSFLHGTKVPMLAGLLLEFSFWMAEGILCLIMRQTEILKASRGSMSLTLTVFHASPLSFECATATKIF